MEGRQDKFIAFVERIAVRKIVSYVDDRRIVNGTGADLFVVALRVWEQLRVLGM